MNKTKEELKTSYEKVCNDYLYKLLDNWNLDEHSNTGWWIGDEVGGMYCLNDDTFINIDDIIYCVNNDITEDMYNEYIDYITKCNDFGFGTINLNAFMKGAPRISDEQFKKLYILKNNLDDEINNIKENF